MVKTEHHGEGLCGVKLLTLWQPGKQRKKKGPGRHGFRFWIMPPVTHLLQVGPMSHLVLTRNSTLLLGSIKGCTHFMKAKASPPGLLSTPPPLAMVTL